MIEDLDTNLDSLLEKYETVSVISFMFYAQPGKRDLLVLEKGISSMYDGKWFVNLSKIDEETARMLQVHRGWKIAFMFPHESSKVIIKELNAMSEYISDGLTTIRVRHALIESKVTKSSDSYV
tara:strand:+ start:1462 stop:1830 length:369 start_codon:yes stop_codon:yes gene_type:complete